MTETIRSKTHKKSGNFRYLCPACGQPAVQPSTLPISNHQCPVSGIEVTIKEVKEAQRIIYPYDNK